MKTRYLHRDHLGSITSITDEAGTEVEAFSFDAWGKRRAPTLAQLEGMLGAWGTLGVYQRGNLTIPALALSSALSDRGFTGHRQLDGVGLIHMGGRVYDAEVGRFLSADPFVRDAADLQALNRYSYVENNPLSYTDPSGYFLKKLVKGIVKAIKTIVSSVVKFERELRRSILRAVGSVEGLSTLVNLVLNAIPGCVGWCSAMLQASFSAAMADANGGTISQALKAGAIAFARAGLEQMGGGASPGGGSGNGQLVFQLDAAAKSMGLERGSSLKDLFVSEAVMRLRVAERKAQAGKSSTSQGQRPDLGVIGNVIRNQVESSIEKDLFAHYWLGRRTNVELTDAQFGRVVDMVSRLPQPDSEQVEINDRGLIRRQFNFPPGEFDAAFGTASVFYDPHDRAVGFYDRYNFNIRWRKTLGPTLKVIGVRIGCAVAGNCEPFDITYGQFVRP